MGITGENGHNNSISSIGCCLQVWYRAISLHIYQFAMLTQEQIPYS
jgi:hypothetical protein